MSPRTRQHAEDWSALRAYLLERKRELVGLRNNPNITPDFRVALTRRLDELDCVSSAMSKIISRHKRRPQRQVSR